MSGKKSIIQLLRLSTPPYLTPSTLYLHRRRLYSPRTTAIATVISSSSSCSLSASSPSLPSSSSSLTSPRGEETLFSSRLLHDDPALVAGPFHRIPEAPLIIGGQSQVRHLGTESTPWFGAEHHQAEHTHRHQTAMFRSGETCPEAGSKRALPSEELGPAPQNQVAIKGCNHGHCLTEAQCQKRPGSEFTKTLATSFLVLN